MIQCTFSDKKLKEQKVGAWVFFLEEDFSFDKELASLAKTYFPHLQTFMAHHKFTGKMGQSLAVVGSDAKGVQHLFFMGLGKKKTIIDVEDYRRLIGSMIRIAESRKIDSLALALPDKKTTGHDLEFIARTTVTTALLAAYRFNDFITDKNAKGFDVKELVLVAETKDKKAVMQGIKVGEIIGQATNRTRHWADLPANVITPPELAKRAKALAKEHGLDITIFDEAKIEKMGMGGIKAVGLASIHDSQLIIMQYKTTKKNAPTLALVGKGITFDSGGLNLKPTGYIETMKEDMTGAAGAINAIVAISQLKPDVNVIAVAACAENMISGAANHPGDIITFYNGKTALVGNTDAEGRLVLADALAYASKEFNPTAMIDIATLTGAVSHAIGPFFNGVLTQDDALADHVEQAGETSGDATWRLPMIERYKKMVENDIADLCNDGKTKYKAGPTNGACFLSHFVGQTPWVHVDIAAAAYDVPDTSYYRSGSTGAGTRLLIDFVMNWK